MNGYRSKVNPFIPYFQQGSEQTPVAKDIMSGSDRRYNSYVDNNGNRYVSKDIMKPYSRYESYVDANGNSVLKMYGAQKHKRKGTSALNAYYKQAQQPVATVTTQGAPKVEGSYFDKRREQRANRIFSNSNIFRDNNGRITLIGDNPSGTPTVQPSTQQNTPSEPVAVTPASNPYLSEQREWSYSPQITYARQTPSERIRSSFGDFNTEQTADYVPSSPEDRMDKQTDASQLWEYTGPGNGPDYTHTNIFDIAPNVNPNYEESDFSRPGIYDVMYPPVNGYYSDEYGTIYNPEVNGENEALRYIRQETGDNEVKYLNDIDDFSRNGHLSYAKGSLSASQPIRLVNDQQIKNTFGNASIRPIDYNSDIRRITDNSYANRPVMQEGKQVNNNENLSTLDWQKAAIDTLSKYPGFFQDLDKTPMYYYTYNDKSPSSFNDVIEMNKKQAQELALLPNDLRRIHKEFHPSYTYDKAKYEKNINALKSIYPYKNANEYDQYVNGKLIYKSPYTQDFLDRVYDYIEGKRPGLTHPDYKYYYPEAKYYEDILMY